MLIRWPAILAAAWFGAGSALAQGVGSHVLLEPPAGRVLDGWGQISGQWFWDDPAAAGDEADLDGYIKAVGADHAPAMISFYIAPVDKQVTGFLRKYPAFVEHHPFFIAQIGLYFLDKQLQEDVAAGVTDPQLRRLFGCIKAAGRPVLLRIGHEFNQHEEAYDTILYIPAFRRVAQLAHEIAPGLIATVWAAEPAGFADRNFMDWYPGDAFVDWWGLSLFFQEHMTSPLTKAFMAAAAAKHRPVLIGESSPWFHGDKARPVRGAASLTEAKSWYRAMFAFIAAHAQVKAVSFIVVDWQRWNPIFSHVPGGFPDARLTLWPELGPWFAKQIAASRFIHFAEAQDMLKQR